MGINPRIKPESVRLVRGYIMEFIESNWDAITELEFTPSTESFLEGIENAVWVKDTTPRDEELITCSECNTRVATLHCIQCKDQFCAICSSLTHAIGKLSLHSREPLVQDVCKECQVQLAVWKVIQSSGQVVDLCEACFNLRKGLDTNNAVPRRVRPHTLRCSECAQGLADIICWECQTHMCNKCSQRVHHRGVASQHSVSWMDRDGFVWRRGEPLSSRDVRQGISGSAEIQDSTTRFEDDMWCSYSHKIPKHEVDSPSLSINIYRHGNGMEKMAEPLQVVTVDSNTSEIRVVRDALDVVAANLKATGVDNIAIVSVMGAYRTGKSFLLDLFLRFLRYESGKRASGDDKSTSLPAGESIGSWENGLPQWLTNEGDSLLEGTDADSKGFQWRGGMEKCTQGIWLWSHPFVIKQTYQDEGGFERMEDVAVLLLDSQGAFDSQMTKEQSATIFGLTAVLSSHQIYNVSMQLQEDKIESLHYFMECAGSCLRFLSEDKSKSNPKLFQHLEFLVRDWPNFDPEWEIKRCEKQMRDHLEQHFDHARDSETPDAIKSMFEEISCWMLPHPGLKINKVGWDGRLSDLDKDFVKFLDAYVRKTFGPTLRARKILGNSLSAATFVGVVESFVEAFVDLVPKGASLATAIAKSANLISKEHALSEYRSNLEKTIGGEGSKGVDPDEFVRGEKRARAQALDHFMKGTAFGPEEERDIVKRALVQELDGFRVLYESENRRKMESALTVFAGIALLIGLLYSVDKISDFTCDWYSDTCVRLSNALFLIYITLIVAILTNAYFLYQSRGQAVALVALIEMGKAAVTMIADYSRSVRKIISDWQASRSEDVFSDLRVLGQRIGRDVQSGLIAIGSSFAGAFSRQDPKE